jgi:hypothetical protein
MAPTRRSGTSSSHNFVIITVGTVHTDVDTLYTCTGLGAWCFFFGTSLYAVGPLEGEDSLLTVVLQIWVLGSVWFTLGGCFVAYRHFVMRVI